MSIGSESSKEELLNLCQVRYGEVFGMSEGMEHFFNFPNGHLNDYTVVTICTNGVIKTLCNGKNYIFGKNYFSLITKGNNKDFKIESISDDFCGSRLLISPEYGKILYNDYLPSMSLFFEEHPYLEVEEKDMKQLESLFNLLRLTIVNGDDDAKGTMIKLLFDFFFQVISHMTEYKKFRKQDDETRMKALFESFQKLLDTYHETTRSASFYADKLCITTSYLYKVVKKATGLSTKNYIENYVLQVARKLFKEGKSVKEVTYSLGFPNQSAFGSFFRRNTGQSPVAFKKDKAL
jgi:AraC-like DNA-binding protein